MLLNEDGTLIDLHTLEAQWLKRGVRVGQVPLVMLCGTGWRSSIGFLLAHLMGLDSTNYDDGFYGWSCDIANPIANETTFEPCQLDHFCRSTLRRAAAAADCKTSVMPTQCQIEACETLGSVPVLP